MPRKKRVEVATVVPLRQRYREASEAVERAKLPGWSEYLATDAKVADWIQEQKEKIEAGVAFDDEFVFERALATWRRAWARVNELLADAYHAAHPDPDSWDLRFFKWMTRVEWVKFGSPLGEFYVVPRKVPAELEGQHCYTADEMMDMLHPTVAAAINEFGQLPVSVTSLPGPVAGEKFLIADFGGGAPQIRYRLS